MLRTSRSNRVIHMYVPDCTSMSLYVQHLRSFEAGLGNTLLQWGCRSALQKWTEARRFGEAKLCTGSNQVLCVFANPRIKTISPKSIDSVQTVCILGLQCLQVKHLKQNSQSQALRAWSHFAHQEVHCATSHCACKAAHYVKKKTQLSLVHLDDLGQILFS